MRRYTIKDGLSHLLNWFLMSHMVQHKNCKKNSGFAERTLSTDHSYDCYFTCPLSVNNFKSTYLKFIFIQLIHLVASGSK